MANHKLISILKQSVQVWNEYRDKSDLKRPDLSGGYLRRARLSGANLSGANLSGANLSEADLGGAELWRSNLREANLRLANLHEAEMYGVNLLGADLRGAFLSRAQLARVNLSGKNLRRAQLWEAHLVGANLRGADLWRANLTAADFTAADLRRANLSGADLWKANFRQANLSGANLSGTYLAEANLTKANLRGTDLRGALLMGVSLVEANCARTLFTGCWVYGISTWNLTLTGAEQSNLVITRKPDPVITVDNLEMAQFMYLLLKNERIRHAIDSITSKVVLILGRFTAKRKVVLEALRETLRARGYLPVLFDFDRPRSRDITETVSTLAHMARFVIADITDAKSIPQELMAIVPNLPSVPVQPVLLASQQEYGMFEHFKRYPSVLKTVLYQSQKMLLRSLEAAVILPAEQKAKELADSQRK